MASASCGRGCCRGERQTAHKRRACAAQMVARPRPLTQLDANSHSFLCSLVVCSCICCFLFFFESASNCESRINLPLLLLHNIMWQICGFGARLNFSTFLIIALLLIFPGSYDPLCLDPNLTHLKRPQMTSPSSSSPVIDISERMWVGEGLRGRTPG